MTFLGFVSNKRLHLFAGICILGIPLIGKDGDDFINNVTCALTGTESICVHRVYTGNNSELYKEN